MKKIIATILSLLAILSICNVSAFAFPEDNNELNQERQAKSRTRNPITEEKRRELKEAYERIKEKEPNLSDRKICEKIGQEFEISTSAVRRHVINKEKNEEKSTKAVLNLEAYKKYIEDNKAKFEEQARKFYQEDDERELNQEKQTKCRSRKPITEEKRNELKEAFERIKEQEPNLSDQQICEKVGQKFDVSANVVRSHVLDFEAYKKYLENSKEKDRQYYQANKEKINERQRQYYQENQAKIKEKQKQYYQENQEKIRQYYQANQARIKEQHKKYYQENKAQIMQRRTERQQQKTTRNVV